MLTQKKVLSKFNYKLFFVVLIFTLIANLNVSDGGNLEGPSAALIQYLDASYNSKLEVAYQHISFKDKNVLTSSEFISQRKGGRARGGLFSSAYSFQIISLHFDESAAEVEIVIRKSNPLNELSRLFDFALKAIIGFEEFWISEAHVGSKKSVETPLIASVKKFTLLKENGGWKVFLGLEKKKKSSNHVTT